MASINGKKFALVLNVKTFLKAPNLNAQNFCQFFKMDIYGFIEEWDRKTFWEKIKDFGLDGHLKSQRKFYALAMAAIIILAIILIGCKKTYLIDK